MATKAVTITNGNDGDQVTATWATMANGDDGTPIGFPQLSDAISVQVKGTPGAGFSLNIEGSNDGGTTWAILSNQAGTALTLTAVGIKAVAESTLLLRPRITAGDGTTAIVVIAVLRRRLQPRQ